MEIPITFLRYHPDAWNMIPCWLPTYKASRSVCSHTLNGGISCFLPAVDFYSRTQLEELCMIQIVLYVPFCLPYLGSSSGAETKCLAPVSLRTPLSKIPLSSYWPTSGNLRRGIPVFSGRTCLDETTRYTKVEKSSVS